MPECDILSLGEQFLMLQRTVKPSKYKKFSPNSALSHPRIYDFSVALLWEPQISRSSINVTFTANFFLSRTYAVVINKDSKNLKSKGVAMPDSAEWTPIFYLLVSKLVTHTALPVF